MVTTRTLALLTLLGAGIVMPGCASAPDRSDAAEDMSHSSEADLAATSTMNYFLVRSDARRCAFPSCGGYWVSRANRPTTRCADGRTGAECYVPSVDLTGAGITAAQASQIATSIGGQVSTTRVVLRGSFVTKTYPPYGSV